MSQFMMNAFAKILARATVFLTCLLLASCTSKQLSVETMHSKNYGQRIKFLVMHYTALDYQNSVSKLVNKGRISAHYLVPESHDKTYLDEDLAVLQLVNEEQQAWHADKSHFFNDHA